MSSRRNLNPNNNNNNSKSNNGIPSNGDDDPHVCFTCLPHTSVTSRVSFAVRSAHCSPPIFSLDNENTNNDDYSTNENMSSVLLIDDGQFLSSSSSSFYGNGGGDISSVLTPSGTELRVVATVHGLGSPMHGVSISTTSAPLHPVFSTTTSEQMNTNNNNNNSNKNSTTAKSTAIRSGTKERIIPYPSCLGTHSCRWDMMSHKDIPLEKENEGELGDQKNYEDNIIRVGGVGKGGGVLSMPVRWRDLPRDAFLALDVIGPGQRQIWGTTLPLFDRTGRLRTGLQRLYLHPGLKANNDTTTTTHPTTSTKPTPGILPPLEHDDDWRRRIGPGSIVSSPYLRSSPDWDDPWWEASYVLDQLHKLHKSWSINGTTTTSTTTTSAAGSSKSRGKNGGISSIQQQQQTSRKSQSSSTVVPSVPWLDKITKDQCLEELRSDPTDWMHEHSSSTRSWSEPQPSFLIIELPSFNVPVIHEETFYPPSTHGASGSISSLDISLYQRRRKQQQQKQAAATRKNSSSSNNNNNALSSTTIQPIEKLGLSLVRGFLDYENESDNPIEDKYRTLARDTLRGLVDPALKPDRNQRARLESIIISPSQHLSNEEKDLLWRFRFSLVDNRRALTKFLLAVDWTVEGEVVQAAELLEQWRRRSPIEVTDALKLLGKNVAFQTTLVRTYAIDTLAAAPDEELRLYLLQLVQAMKYEEVSTPLGETKEQSGNNNNFPERRGRTPLTTSSSSSSNHGKNHTTSLSSFLIERASKSLFVANYLYWYIKVELNDPTYGSRYQTIFKLLEEKLSSSYWSGQQILESKGSFIPSIITPITPTTSTLKRRSIWTILKAQDQFISGITSIQLKSRDTKGKRDAKELHLRESLASNGYTCISSSSSGSGGGSGQSVPLPSNPKIWIHGIKPETARMFKSALYPAVIEFSVERHENDNDDDDNATSSGISAAGATAATTTTTTGVTDNSNTDSSSVVSTSTKKTETTEDDNDEEKMTTYKVIVKTGDDLRQDQLIIMMIQLMDGLLKRNTLDLCLRPYAIMAMSHSSGLVEFVDQSMPISMILSQYSNSIMQFFQSVAPMVGTKYNVRPDVIQTYVRSCAGYCVITYLLGVGDRHLDNILIQPSGHFFHIDFGFILGRDPKPLPPAFRLTREMVDGMGGTDSSEYHQFCSLACQAFNLLRKSAGLVLTLLHLMSDAGIEDLSNNPSADADGVIAKVEERFKLELTDEQAETFFLGLIHDSLAALAPRFMEVIHQISVARR